jgi:hypothetical protein
VTAIATAIAATAIAATALAGLVAEVVGRGHEA